MTPQPLDYETPQARSRRAAGASMGILSLLLFSLAMSFLSAAFPRAAIAIAGLGCVAGAAGLFLDRLRIVAVLGITLNVVFVAVFSLGISFALRRVFEPGGFSPSGSRVIEGNPH